MSSLKGKQTIYTWERLTPLHMLQLVSVFLSVLSLSNAFSSTSSTILRSPKTTTIIRTCIHLKNHNYENTKIDKRFRIGQSSVSFLSYFQQQQYKVAIKESAFQLFGSSKNIEEDAFDDENDNDDDTEEDDEDDFIVTPNQIKTLRKEADKRRANGRLVSYLLPIHETSRINNYEEETLYSIGDLFTTNADSNNMAVNELVEVRGICSSYSTTGSKASTSTSTSSSSSSTTIVPTKTNRVVVERRHIVSAADEIAIDVATVALNKPVIVVEVRGHRAILYSPALYWDDDNNNDNKTDASTTQQQQQQQNTLLLRSSYRKNQWKKRPRAVRDSKGQIVTDENGNIVYDYKK